MLSNTQFALRSALLALVATLLFSVSAIAQVDAGAVRGTVTDPLGAVVANAKVTLTNDATGLSTSTVTAADGTYTFGPIKIGPYTIDVEAGGFRKATTHVVVNVQEQARADFKLVTGAITETVEGLERERLVRRESDADDRRAVRVALTAEGRKQLHQFELACAASLAERLAPLTATQRHRIRAAFEDLREVIVTKNFMPSSQADANLRPSTRKEAVHAR